MNVFDAIYLNESDPIERSFIAAETALDIAVARANKEYAFESGLIELSENKLFMESEESTDDSIVDSKKENAFIKAVKAICTAIRNFIRDIIDTVTNLFDGRDNITPEDYLTSPTGSVRLIKDVEKLEKIVDDELRQGNKLLQKVSSITGISDEVIDKWIKSGAEKIGKLAPVIIPAAIGFGFRRIFKSGMNDKNKVVDDAEKQATSGDNSDPTKNKQKTTILGHMQWLIRQIGDAASDWSKEMNKARKRNK